MLAGCSSTNLADIVKAAGQDPATVCVTAAYAGAMVNISRTNITNGDVQCNGNGLSVKSSTIVPIELQVTPVPR